MRSASLRDTGRRLSLRLLTGSSCRAHPRVRLEGMGKNLVEGQRWREGWREGWRWTANPVSLPGSGSCGRRWFSNTQVARCGNGGDNREEKKRLPSDDPSQLPEHFFLGAGSNVPKPVKTGMFHRISVDLTTRVLGRMSKEEFDRDEFLEGCIGAFEQIMETFTSNTTEGLEELMEERVLEAFQHCLKEYSEHGIVCDYESGAVQEAEILRVQFLHDEDKGVDAAWVDVQFVNKQRINLRDETGRTVGPEGEWVLRPTVWRFSSTLPELKWILSDMP